MLDEEVIIMGRKASYRRNNVKEAVNDETAVKNVETVKEKFEAVKDKAEAAVEAVKENVKAEAVKAEAAVTAKAETVKSAEKKETVELKTAWGNLQQERTERKTNQQLEEIPHFLFRQYQ